MDKYERNIIHSKRLKLTTYKWILHLSYLLFPVLFLFLTNQDRGIEADISQVRLVLINSFLIIWIVYIIVIKVKELNFKVINYSRSIEQFNQTVNATGLKLKWQIERKYDKLINAKSYQQLWISRMDIGQSITILYTPEKVYINSIRIQHLFSTPSIFANRENTSTFEKLYLQSNDKNVETSTIEEQNTETNFLDNNPEWKLKNIAKRAVIYTIGLILMYLVLIEATRNEINYFLIILIGVGLSLLIFDLVYYVKRGKRKVAAHNN